MGSIKICKRLMLQAYKNKILFVLVLVPIVAFVISVLISLPASRIITLGIIDEDKTALSEMFIRVMEENDSFRLIMSDDVEEMLESLRNQDIEIGMKINSGFYENLNEQGAVELFQTSDIETFMLVELYLNSSLDNLVLLRMVTEDEAELVEGLEDYIASKSVTTNILENERARGVFSSTAFGFLLMFMLLVSVLSSKLIADDRFTLTIKRIFMASIPLSSYVVGGFLSNFIFQMIQIAVIIAISFAVGFEFTIPIYAMFSLFIIFAVFASFFGLLIGFVSKNTNQMIITSQMFILPGTLLSGTFFDFLWMPQWLQQVAFVFPQTWVTQAPRYFGTDYFGTYFLTMIAYYAFVCLVIMTYLLIMFKKKKVMSFY